MIDSDKINAAITKKLTEAVNEQVAILFKSNTELVDNLKAQAAMLLVRNFDFNKELKKGLTKDISNHVADLLLNEANTLLDRDAINTAVADNIASATANHIASLIDKDAKLLGHIKKQAITSILDSIKIENNLETIIGNKIAQQFAKQFNGNAIANSSKKRELTIMNNAVVVEKTMVAKNVEVVDTLDTTNATVNGQLTVNGTVDLRTGAWDKLSANIKDSIVTELDTVINTSIKNNVDEINFDAIKLNGADVLTGNTLGAQITDSSLTSVGTLNGLQVKGTSDIDALHIEHKRVGINTTSPSSALAIWDDEVEVIAGKLKAQTGFIGTNRTQELVIGVGRRDDITIGIDGTTTIKKLKLGQRSISHGSGTPGYAGKQGDIVLNTNLTLANPVFAWYCLHDYSWVPLKASI